MTGVALAALDAASRLSLAGRTALVTGGSGGIGAAVVATLAQAGARVVSVDLPGQPQPPGAEALECDLGDAAAVGRLVERLRRIHPELHLLVHCAGITRDGVLWKLADEDWTEVLRVNLDSAFHLLKGCTPLLRAAAASGGCSVVLVTSINGERGRFGQANYAASKAGLIALARTAARELGRFGVRVNCVAPGLIVTAMTRALPPEAAERSIAETALGHAGRPQDVADAVLYLCSGMSVHVTGQVLRVDGGQLMA